MIRDRNDSDKVTRGDTGDPAAQSPGGAEPAEGRVSERGVFGGTFWFCYLSNAMLMIGVSILFRYADFVSHLGGSEWHLGAIVGVGMIGGLAVRVLLGVGIDRYGPRRIWLGSLSLFTLAVLAHLLIDTVHGPAVYVVRILLTIGVAGGVGASLTYVSLRVPEFRVAEMVGTLGSSGFLGLAIGPGVGDLLFRSSPIARQHLDRMFLLSALAGGIALIAAVIATRGQVRRRVERRDAAVFPLIRRYHPGILLLVAFAMGLGVGLPGVFVRAYAAELEIAGIYSYFLVYAFVAFTVRVTTRRLTQHIGIRPVILIGLAALSSSMVFYLVVQQAWQFAVPAVVAGVAHALLFPAIISGGATSFPTRYRGLATTFVLGVVDCGKLIGQPTIGNILYYADQLALPKYPTMFLSVAFFLAAVATIYASVSRPSNETDQQPAEEVSEARSDGLADHPSSAEVPVRASSNGRHSSFKLR